MLVIGEKKIKSRLLLGTARYPAPDILMDSIEKSDTEIITVSLRRQLASQNENDFWKLLKKLPCHILPNTAGCFNAKEAITTAQMARELFSTHWIKLEVIADDESLQPNVFELVKAAEQLIQQGFEVFPYCTDDLLVCQKLVDCGCHILMPWAAPIGTGRGIQNPYALQLLRDRFPDNILIIDAGIGKPSHASFAMELGFDAVLLNTAVAKATDPVSMAKAFSLAIKSGRLAYEAGCIIPRNNATASTPLINKPFWKLPSEIN